MAYAALVPEPTNVRNRKPARLRRRATASLQLRRVNRRFCHCPWQPQAHYSEGYMNLNLTGKTALVTAASGGIGSGVAEALAEAGVRVAISGRTLASLEMVAETLASRAGGRPAIVVGDIGAKGGPAQRPQRYSVVASTSSSITLVGRDRSLARWMMPIGTSRSLATSWRRGG
jgi:hypothetical protein